MKRLALLLVAVLCSASAQAKLAMSSFDQMVSSSEMIVLAKPIEFHDMETVFELRTTYKGQSKSPQVKIVRSREVHDQRVILAVDHILFLRRASGEDSWTGTSYGRSYWPLLPVRSDSGCKRGVPVVYPFNMVEPGKHLKSKESRVVHWYLPRAASKTKQPVYCEAEIIRAIDHLSTQDK